MKSTFTTWLLGAALLLTGAPVATGQVLQSEPFTAVSASSWRFGGSARLTAGSLDAPGQGYLRLTDAEHNQSGFALSRAAFSSTQGFNISFEFFSYGGTPAFDLYGDGFSVFLVDGKTDPDQFAPGATGGALGYTQHVPDPYNPVPGVAGGIYGIGFDEFGYYASSDGHTDGLGGGVFPQRISVRGAGNGMQGFNLLKASDRLPFDLNTNTARAQKGSPDYRRATINVVPLGGTYRVTVRVQNSQQVVTALSEYDLPSPPSTLRLGFGGSTGGATSTHEIRNLVIVVPPTAADDYVVTANNTPTTIAVLNNDAAPGSTLDPSTIDLDPTTTTIDHTLTIPEGSFSVNSAGVVSYSPAGPGVVNTVRIPYVVSSRNVYDNLGNLIAPTTATNPAYINVGVGAQGADVASYLTGPATVKPGGIITYQMTMKNLSNVPVDGLRPALYVSDGIQPAPGAPAPAGGHDGPFWQFLTPGQSITLAAGQSVTYTASFVAPASNSGIKTIYGTGYNTSTYSPDPDPNSYNNNGGWSNAKVATNISTPPNQPLPVELSHFTAKLSSSHKAMLNWGTASEKNSSYFGVERSTNGVTFTQISRVAAAGFSTALNVYLFRDPVAANGLTYYRLRQVDTDSSAHYSPVVTVNAPLTQAPASVQVYPNPVLGSASPILVCANLTGQALHVTVLDAMGRPVLTQELLASGPASEIPLTLPGSGLTPGVYLVRVASAALRTSWHTRFLVQPY